MMINLAINLNENVFSSGRADVEGRRAVIADFGVNERDGSHSV